MKKILLVEDDAVVVEIYRKKFLREGFHVDVAEDGLVAMKQLPIVKPDLVVLDLMMPKFNGADVLKFIRANTDLKSTKVVIFSNAYMTEVALEAAKIGADASLLKSSCTPAQLISVVRMLLDVGQPDESLPAPTPLAAPAAPAPAKPAAPPAANEPDMARPFTLQSGDSARLAPAERARRDFAKTATDALAAIRGLFESFAQPGEPQFRQMRLMDLHRQMHFFADLSNVAQRLRLAHLASAAEALLFELQERPKNINSSTIQTIDAALKLLGELIQRAEKNEEEPVTPTNLLAVLVVDDEPLANRALVHALSRANVRAASTADPHKAVELFTKSHYDLLLLDYLMPGMDGLELYKKLRALPQYAKTPVIFITSATEFKSRAEQVLGQGDDIISKPILPIELAVKSLTLLMRSQLA